MQESEEIILQIVEAAQDWFDKGGDQDTSRALASAVIAYRNLQDQPINDTQPEEEQNHGQN